MTQHDSAITPPAQVLPARPGAGLWWGLLGVVAFSLTVPLTRVVVVDASPVFVGAARAVLAGVLASGALLLARERLPRRGLWLRLVVVAGGVVVGFPLLTSAALVTVPATHAAVVIALLPAATAVTAALRGHERLPLRFWLFAGLGAAATVGFVTAGSGGPGGLHPADLLLLLAVVAAAVGYAEGGLLARELGSWQTVSWALVVSAPLMVVLTAATLLTVPGATPTTPQQWAAFAYLGVVSMFLGFVAWYRGLALGPMAQVSQVQLVQPVLSIGWAALLLGEALTWVTVVGGLVVVACAASAVRVRLRAPRDG